MRANEGLNIVDEGGGKKLYQRGIMHCCTANGARTLYYVWDSIVTGEGNRARVNLLLNRASEWVDVDSYLPFEGKVVLKIKKANSVEVRLPEWVKLNEVRVEVDAKKAEHKLDGRYVSIDKLKSGQEVALRFSVAERTMYRAIGRRPYKLTIRGSDVVSIDPPGIAYPLYQDKAQGQLVEKARFVPAKKVIW
ncbi:MAG: hypothetical protein EXQ58_03330 [Acidobacteria bacterium]|nr:hypothetical protein [Acidobacteriota bacterium]